MFSKLFGKKPAQNNTVAQKPPQTNKAVEKPAQPITDKGARKLNEAGNGAFLKGDLDAALEQYKAALVLDEEEGDLWGKSANLSNIGIIYVSQGEAQLAIASFQASDEILKQLNLEGERAILQYHLGWAYTGNDPALSKQAFQAAASLAARNGNQKIAEKAGLILKALEEQGTFSIKPELAFQIKNSKWRLQPSFMAKGMSFNLNSH